MSKPLSPSELLDIVREIGLSKAAPHAEDVDRDARFPSETFEALRDAGVLSAPVPTALGGGGCELDILAQLCTALARHCASSGMILAMHYIQVNSIIHHHGDSPEFEAYLRELSRKQRLIASATSEVGTGGDLGQSIACLEPKDDHFHFTKAATTISYVQHADDLLVTLRRASDAAANDQVLVLVQRDQFTLNDVGRWNTLGMRGTCSPPARVTGECDAWQRLADPFRTIANESMVPVSHILWAATWAGIAADAFDRARRVLQLRVRKDPDGSPLAAARLAGLATQLTGMQNRIEVAIRDHISRTKRSPSERGMTLGDSLRANDLKLATSEQLVEIVTQAIQVSGMAAYQVDGEFSLDRHLRDAHSAPLMINNDRIRGSNADHLLVYKGR